jgi:hypothetical protein
MDRIVTYENVKYGMLVEILDPNGSYHAGCKVYFFNRKGVLVGNIYKFLAYENLRLREGTCSKCENDRQYPRYFMGNNYIQKNIPLGEKIKMLLFVRLCNVVTGLIKFTQKYMD